MADVGKLIVTIGGETYQLERSLNRSKRQLNSFVGSSKASLMKFGAAFGAVGVAAGSAMIFKGIIRSGAEFQQTMTTAGAVMRATAEEMDALTAKAREMGETTEWTASQSGEALKFLGMAGFQAGKAISALPGVLDLATAGGLDLGRAADIASNALTAMGLPVEELSRVNDVFVGTITRSNTNMEMMAESFKYSAPVARAYGYSIEELSGLIGSLGNAGIQGSMAGTQLAMAIQKANVIAAKFKLTSSDLVDVLEEMRKKGYEDTQIMKEFGLRAGRAAGVLLQAIPDVKKFQETLGGVAGEAETLADKMRSTLGGAFKELRSVVESVGLDIFNTFGNQLKVLVKNISEWVRENKQAIVGLTDAMVTAVATIGGAVKDLVDVLMVIPTTFASVFRSVRAEAESVTNDMLALAVRAQGAFIPPPLDPWKEFVMFLNDVGNNMIVYLKTIAKSFAMFVASAVRLIIVDLIGNVLQGFLTALVMVGSAIEAVFTRDLNRTRQLAEQAATEFEEIFTGGLKTGQRFEQGMAKIWDDMVKDLEWRSPAKQWADQWEEAYARASAALMGPSGHLAGAGDGIHVPKPVIPGIGDEATKKMKDLANERMRTLEKERALYEELFRSGEMTYEGMQRVAKDYARVRRELIEAEMAQLRKMGVAESLIANTTILRFRQMNEDLKRLFGEQGNWFLAWAESVSGDMARTFEQLFFKPLMGDFKDNLRDWIRAITAVFMRDLARQMGEQTTNWLLRGIAAATGSKWEPKKAESFQHGGLVTSPTFAMIGEVPELVIPLHRLDDPKFLSRIRGGDGATIHQTFHVEGPSPLTNPTSRVQLLSDAAMSLRRAQRNL